MSVSRYSGRKYAQPVCPVNPKHPLPAVRTDGLPVELIQAELVKVGDACRTCAAEREVQEARSLTPAELHARTRRDWPALYPED